MFGTPWIELNILYTVYISLYMYICICSIWRCISYKFLMLNILVQLQQFWLTCRRENFAPWCAYIYIQHIDSDIYIPMYKQKYSVYIYIYEYPLHCFYLLTFFPSHRHPRFLGVRRSKSQEVERNHPVTGRTPVEVRQGSCLMNQIKVCFVGTKKNPKNICNQRKQLHIWLLFLCFGCLFQIVLIEWPWETC